jgi:high affinity Mn2+ porin
MILMTQNTKSVRRAGWVALMMMTMVQAASATPPATQPTTGAAKNAANSAAQNWNFHIQNTEIVQGDPAFSARYSGPHSLPDGGETRETVSLDVMAGARLWTGAEAHFDGLMWQGFGIGNSLGAEGFPSGEAYRLGTSDPNGAIARLFLRQTIGLGGEQEDVPDGPFTLAGKQDVSRLTFTVGRFSASDVFDANAYANDPRTQFLNWGLVNNEGWDYPANSIGYTTGLAAELNQPDWTLRYGFFQTPSVQNGLNGEDRIFKWPYDPSSDGPSDDGLFLKAWGMVTEFERRYSIDAHPGTIRFLAYLNRADMASYSEATDILKASGPGADISAARAYRCKYGFGLNWEQEVANNVGIFSRLGWNDGREQGWMFSDVGYAGSLGVSIKGEAWDRPNDTFALAGVLSGIPRVEQDYFRAGGLGILAGDGNLNYGLEKTLETYYDFAAWAAVHVALDYQVISDPAFNRERGPVSVFGLRFHWEL